MTRTRIALITVGVALIAGFVGTAGNSASDRVATTSAHPAGLVSFRSCGDLLGYVKSQAVPLVGAWGLGGLHAPGPLPPGVAVPAAGSAKTDAGTGPTEGIDYSGTNVQEQGVDEPDSVKTNGKTLFAVAGNRLNAVDVTSSHPKLLDSLKLDTGWSHELLLVGDHLLVLSRGGYWLTPLPAQTALALPFYPPRQPSPRSTSRTRRRCGSSTRSRSTAATSTRASSARARASSSPRRCRRSCPS